MSVQLSLAALITITKCRDFTLFRSFEGKYDLTGVQIFSKRYSGALACKFDPAWKTLRSLHTPPQWGGLVDTLSHHQSVGQTSAPNPPPPFGNISPSDPESILHHTQESPSNSSGLATHSYRLVSSFPMHTDKLSWFSPGTFPTFLAALQAALDHVIQYIELAWRSGDAPFI